MDTDTLVRNRVDEGRKLVQQLLQDGFDLRAALWLKASENGKWYFYIVSPIVDAEGLTEAYRSLHPLAHKIKEISWIDPLEITLIGPNNPIARDVLAAIGAHAPNPQVSAIRWKGKTLGNLSIEGAFLYKLPVTAP